MGQHLGRKPVSGRGAGRFCGFEKRGVVFVIFEEKSLGFFWIFLDDVRFLVLFFAFSNGFFMVFAMSLSSFGVFGVSSIRSLRQQHGALVARYPPKLKKLIAKRKNFSQLEDFNRKQVSKRTCFFPKQWLHGRVRSGYALCAGGFVCVGMPF